jgi:CHAT domain-containing protein
VPPLARLVFHVGEAQTVVLAVAPDGGIAGAAIPIGAAALAERVRALLGALGVDGPVRGGAAIHLPGASAASPAGPVEPLLEATYRDLVAPVARGLPRPGATLVLEPHGPLWLVPFAALRIGGGEWLVDRWPITYAPSSAVLDELRAPPGGSPPASAPALLVGDPLTAALPVVERDASYEFQPLPGTRREVAEIARLFTGQPPDVRVGPRAALDGVVEDVHRFRVVHLATHGVALGRDPLGSFLVLGDSRCGRYLTARDVTQLGLAADLVALSACQTGLGQLSGDGVIGLARSFLVAGARTVLVSLWNVSDVRTAELMAEFYREWLSRGADKASALRRAMLAVRKGHPDPRLWAPFLLVGAER